MENTSCPMFEVDNYTMCVSCLFLLEVHGWAEKCGSIDSNGGTTLSDFVDHEDDATFYTQEQRNRISCYGSMKRDVEEVAKELFDEWVDLGFPRSFASAP